MLLIFAIQLFFKDYDFTAYWFYFIKYFIFFFINGFCIFSHNTVNNSINAIHKSFKRQYNHFFENINCKTNDGFCGYFLPTIKNSPF